MKDYVNRSVIPSIILAMTGAFTLLIIYICYDYVVTGEMSLKWYDFTEPGTAIEITVTNLLLMGALSGLIIGRMVRLLRIPLDNRLGMVVVLGIAGAIVVALFFCYLVRTSAYYHGPVAPGG